ncbi:Co-chaperone Hsc20, partial [Pholiota conissans]
CPSCRRPLPSRLPACTACWSIHPLPPKISYHDLFGLPDTPNPFVIDLPTLKQRFRQAQASCHPDTWVSKSSKDGDIAHTLSSRLNEAYQTLLHPLARAEYILMQNGYQISESDQTEDMAFMMEIMEAREAIDDATSDNVHAIEEILENNRENINTTIQDIRTFAQQHNWADMKAATIRLRYLEGIKRAASKWIDNH